MLECKAFRVRNKGNNKGNAFKRREHTLGMPKFLYPWIVCVVTTICCSVPSSSREILQFAHNNHDNNNRTHTWFFFYLRPGRWRLPEKFRKKYGKSTEKGK